MYAPLILLLVTSDTSARAFRPVQSIDLGKLTWAEAKRIEGKWVRVVFVQKGLLCLTDDGPIIEASGKAGISRIVYFEGPRGPSRPAQSGPDVVEGVIRTNRIPPNKIGDVEFEEIWVIEVHDARVAQP
jgi:hypothetical protein